MTLPSRNTLTFTAKISQFPIPYHPASFGWLLPPLASRSAGLSNDDALGRRLTLTFPLHPMQQRRRSAAALRCPNVASSLKDSRGVRSTTICRMAPPLGGVSIRWALIRQRSWLTSDFFPSVFIQQRRRAAAALRCPIGGSSLIVTHLYAPVWVLSIAILFFNSPLLSSSNSAVS